MHARFGVMGTPLITLTGACAKSGKAPEGDAPSAMFCLRGSKNPGRRLYMPSFLFFSALARLAQGSPNHFGPFLGGKPFTSLSSRLFFVCRANVINPRGMYLAVQ